MKHQGITSHGGVHESTPTMLMTTRVPFDAGVARKLTWEDVVRRKV
jgi:hypothetical protein